ncbi:hypothetical protein EKK58_11890 [Candidatus Dependentiae bacterium]|nr:MAG: hypothetical protein EKK58_11890 [Candidatus Dependentiae bacterium]
MKYIMIDAQGERSNIKLKLPKKTLFGIAVFSLAGGFANGWVLGKLLEQWELSEQDHLDASYNKAFQDIR